jgi:hypothetical protein
MVFTLLFTVPACDKKEIRRKSHIREEQRKLKEEQNLENRLKKHHNEILNNLENKENHEKS